MEEGVIVDSGDYDMPKLAKWHRGQPQRKWWGLSFEKKAMMPVASWRCTGCGLLENYAK